MDQIPYPSLLERFFLRLLLLKSFSFLRGSASFAGDGVLENCKLLLCYMYFTQDVGPLGSMLNILIIC